MSRKTNAFLPPSAEEIAAYAYHLWEAEGRQSGRDLTYWMEAKAHLEADRKYQAGLLTGERGSVAAISRRRRNIRKPTEVRQRSGSRPQLTDS